MRLFLSDSFFDRFTQLPRNIQQRVNDFQRKFRDNSQSAAIHLEPIIQFKDSSLRSARVDQDYRAILGSLGQERFMLLWVDKHDNAYRWAQNKKFVWNDHTQSCQIIPLTFEEATSTIEPQNQEEPNVWSNADDEKMLQLGIPEELIPLVRTITDLNMLDENEDRLPQDVYENLFAIFDGENIDDIIADIKEGKAKEGEDILLSNNNKRRFVEITDDEYLAQIMEQGMEKWQIFLHPSQRKLVDSDYNGTVKVSGSAGTGKTIAALHRLKKLCQESGAKVLFTTYTTALKSNLVDLVQKMDIPTQRFELDNIDRILLKVAKDYHVLPTGFDVLDYSGDDKSRALWSEVLNDEVSEFTEEFLYAEYIDVIIYNNNKELRSYLLQSRVGRTKPLTRKQRVEVWKLKEKYEALKTARQAVDRLELFNMTTNYLNDNDIRPYTNVIADEFQDFSNPELRFLRALVKEGRNDLFLTGDPFQRIYTGHKINFSSAGINIRGKKSMKLKVNYRTTEEIKRIAVSVVKGVKYDDLDGGEENNKGYVSLVHGERPSYVVLHSNKDEVKQVMTYLEKCEDEGVDLKDVCIAARTRQLYKDVQDNLHKENIKYQEIKKGERYGAKDGLLLCTFHSLKGLEYRIVILIGVNEKSIPSKESDGYPFNGLDVVERKEYLSSVRSLLYVAITRAREQVYIIGYGEPCGLLTSYE